MATTGHLAYIFTVLKLETPSQITNGNSLILTEVHRTHLSATKIEINVNKIKCNILSLNYFMVASKTLMEL